MSRQPIPPLFGMVAAPSARSPVPPAPDLSDLVGVPFDGEGGMNCWGLMVEAQRRFGVHVPADPAVLLARSDAICRELSAGEACRAGDVLDLIGGAEVEGGGDPHVGVCIDAFDFVHAMRAGSRKDSIAAWQRLGRVRRRLRPLKLEGGE